MKLWNWMAVPAVVLTCSMATAQETGRPGGPGRPDGPPPQDQRGQPSRPGEQGPPPPNPIMEALDPDNDHVITEKEINGAKRALKSLDTNNDGKLTEDEIHPEISDRREGGPPRMEGADRRPGPPGGGQGGPPKGGPGGVGPGAGGLGGGPGAGRPMDPEQLIEHAFEFDADKDGKLSREELLEFAKQMPGPGMHGGPDGGPQSGDRDDQKRPERPRRPSFDK